MASRDLISSLSSQEYFNLRADRANFCGLLRLLTNRDIESDNLEFIDGSGEKITTFKRRGILFLSISMQKFLQSISKPLSRFASSFELCLNLLSHNKSFITWTLEMPDKASSSYRSFIGCLDKRVDLGMFKPGDKKYNGILCAMASKLSNENEAFIKYVVEHRWEKLSTHGFIFHDKNNTIVVVFRGTEPFNADNWSTDFDLSWHEFHRTGRVHSGFAKALGLQKGLQQPWPNEIKQDTKRSVAYYFLRQKLKEIFKKSNKTKFIVTGHSLGGALAVLSAAVLALHKC